MITWLANRLVQAAGVIFAMTLVVFVGLNVVGSPVDILIPPDADANERARIVERLGLDQPLWRQYTSFVTNAVQGDVGDSYVYNQPALDLILERMPATLELAFLAMLIAIVLGIPLGLYAGLNPESPVSRTIMAGSILGFSLPTFWTGLVLIMLFSVHFGVLPASGRGQTVALFGIDWSIFTLDGLRHLILPATNLALFQVSLVIRLTRAGVQEVINQDYVRYARARGMSERRVIWVHVLRNMMIPVVTVIGLEFGSLIAYAIVTETIFSWPGMGKLIIDSINVLDRPVIVAYLVLIVIMFVLINLVVDMLYTILDPRVRLTGGRN